MGDLPEILLRGLLALLTQGTKLFFVVLAFVRLCLFFGTQKYEVRKDMNGLVVVINVKDSGIGIKAAQVLSSRGAMVILGTPDIRKATKKLKGYPRVDIRHLDMCDLKSIRSFADRIIEEQPKIHILINNFGSDTWSSKLTLDGFHEVHQAVYLGPFFLTEMLLPLMKWSAPSRIINAGHLDYLYGLVEVNQFEALIRGRDRGSGDAFSDATLALVMWTKALATELRDSRVTVNLAYPGVAYTLYESFKAYVGRKSARIMGVLCGPSAYVGDHNLLYLCADPIGETETGKLFFNCMMRQMFKAEDPRENEKLFKKTRRLLLETLIR